LAAGKSAAGGWLTEVGVAVAGAAAALSPTAEIGVEGDLSGVASAKSLLAGISSLATAVAAGGAGEPVYSIFSQHPAHDTANSSKAMCIDLVKLCDPSIHLLY
jgi:hypothetical protein